MEGKWKELLRLALFYNFKREIVFILASGVLQCIDDNVPLGDDYVYHMCDMYEIK